MTNIYLITVEKNGMIHREKVEAETSTQAYRSLRLSKGSIVRNIKYLCPKSQEIMTK